MSRPIFDNRSLIDWLEVRRNHGSYEYNHPRLCMLAQYFKEAGLQNPIVDSVKVRYLHVYFGLKETDLPEKWDDVAYGEPRNFGAAFERAKELLK